MQGLRAASENGTRIWMECEQEAGDVLCVKRARASEHGSDSCIGIDKGVVLNLRRYVPCEWGHAVLNIQDTIGMAVEFKYRYTDGT